jgi:tripartite-type tricarboxylate transporter receptor subunit TctC
LAVGTPKRLAAAPDLPTVAETVPGFQFSSWNGFFAPTGTPEPVIAALRTELSAFAKSPAVAERLTSLGIVPGGLTKDETDAVFHHDYAAFAAAIKAAGLGSQ